MLECVVNLSEGRDASVIGAVAGAAGDHLLDVHSDPDHHRTVVTLAGVHTEEAVRAVARRAVELVDLGHHRGVHPRMGALDVVPFVPLGPRGALDARGLGLGAAVAARDRFARWAGDELGLPCFCYGPERSLPEVRRRAFVELVPDAGPPHPHPTAGACAVGARSALIAYNLWLATDDLRVARDIADEVRNAQVRALGFAVRGAVQVSCNLVEPLQFGPAQAYDEVARLARRAGTSVTRAELVGLVPAAVVDSTPADRFEQLDLDPGRTVEARLAVGYTRR